MTNVLTKLEGQFPWEAHQRKKRTVGQKPGKMKHYISSNIKPIKD